MPNSIEIKRVPFQTWSKASDDTGNHSWGLTTDAYTEELKVSRVYKIN